MFGNTLLTRRRLLGHLLGVAASLFALPAHADDAKPKPPTGLKKRPREAVGYRDFPYENRTCAKCMLYVGDGECVIIEGKVSVDGWCNQWTPPTIGQSSQQFRDAAAATVDHSKSTGV
jgi:High potential iron-sulfur protein